MIYGRMILRFGALVRRFGCVFWQDDLRQNDSEVRRFGSVLWFGALVRHVAE
jgi:hypothetical protein